VYSIRIIGEEEFPSHTHYQPKISKSSIISVIKEITESFPPKVYMIKLTNENEV